jgi:hypothetical protein
LDGDRAALEVEAGSYRFVSSMSRWSSQVWACVGQKDGENAADEYGTETKPAPHRW